MTTKQLYVLGHPVAHSKSPVMHNAAYRALGLDWHYGFMDCETEADAWDFLMQPDWLALNVTMPWKGLAIQSSQLASVSARLSRGANVLVRHGGRIFADNTDGKGCTGYLARCGVSFDGAAVVVCGTGPTSLAIMHACLDAGAGSVVLAGRDAARCQAVAEAYRERLATVSATPEDAVATMFDVSAAPASEAGARVSGFDYDRAREAISHADVVVDATPLGMKQGDPAPFDTAVLSAGQVVFDVVYGHGETRLLADARAAGCRALDGRGMLVAQAVETVVDIARVTGFFAEPDRVALFDVMAEAAGFDL